MPIERRALRLEDARDVRLKRGIQGRLDPSGLTASRPRAGQDHLDEMRREEPAVVAGEREPLRPGLVELCAGERAGRSHAREHDALA